MQPGSRVRSNGSSFSKCGEPTKSATEVKPAPKCTNLRASVAAPSFYKQYFSNSTPSQKAGPGAVQQSNGNLPRQI